MNEIDIFGFLREKIDDYHRKFEFDLPYIQMNNEAKPIVTIRYWATTPNPRLLVMPEGTRIAFHGHLDIEEKFGTIIVVEQFEVLRQA